MAQVTAETGTILTVEGERPSSLDALLALDGALTILRPGEKGAADVIVIGPEVDGPLATARRLRLAHPGAQVLFVLPSWRLDRFRAMLPFDPELSDAWTAESVPGGGAPDALRAALRVARERQQAARLTDGVNRLLNRRPDAEAQARQRRVALSEAYLARVLSQAADPIFAAAPDGELVAWNDAASRLFGSMPGGDGRPSLFDCVAPDEVEQLSALLRRAAAGEDPGPAELRFARADGETVHLELRLARAGGGERPGIVVSCVARDVTERRRAEERLRTALAEKDVLLREVHHRVKNNLQVVMSLLRMRSRGLQPEVAAPFTESVVRIQAMAKLHDRLSGSRNLASIDFTGFMEDLCLDLVRAFGMEKRVRFRVEGVRVTFDLETATPTALILAEIVTNALKHAFPGQRGGMIAITGRNTDAGIELTIRDDGIGSAPDQARAGSLGLKVVDALCRQLHASLEMRSERGTTVVLTIPHRDGEDGS